MERMPKYWEKLTSQEILSYHASQDKGFHRKWVCFGVNNRRMGPQLPILKDKADDVA